MGVDDVTVPLENPAVSVDISAWSRHTFLIEWGGRAYVAGFVKSAFGYLQGPCGFGAADEHARRQV